MSKNRQSLLRWIFIPFLLFLWAGPAWGAVYKWKDENGRLHFTDDITKIPLEHRPHHTNKKPKKKIEKPETSTGKNLKKGGTSLGQGMEQGMGQLAEGLAEGLTKAFEGMMGEGFGELMQIAEANKPDDMEKTTFSSKEEEIEHKLQQFLIGMFLMCQFQFIMEKSTTCSDKGMEIDEKKWGDFKDYVGEISPRQNTRTNLLIRAYHKNSGEVWQITEDGKSSVKKVPKENKKKKI
ncbi:MAG: DUF4124 domain-containing protein [Nitrospinaceae bacterium]|jgi:hypothetical protein|nr:DUF4124 domain-containing protein [Nitrospina sp.]MBT5549612.1 DUF4124 domain-containing protein [Nitrospina sp.]MBT5870006.1 DUF4124 domain-containing protein [Nitrospinaceae bacterium]